MMYFALQILLAAVLLFWSLRIFLSKNLRKSQLLMVAGMCLSAFALFFPSPAALFVFPWFFLALRENTVKGGIPKWDWLILLPSLIVSTMNSPLIFTVFLCVQMLGLSIWAALDVWRYNRLVAEYFDTENESSDALSQILLYMLASVTVVLMMLWLKERLASNLPVGIVLFLFLTVLQCLLGMTVFRLDTQPTMPDETPEMPETVDEPAVGQTVPDRGNESDRKLLQRVEDEKMFLDPTVSLVSLAEKLSTNRTYLSSSIHACRYQNFSDFINRLRIEYALELMRAEKPDVNIKEVAMRSGYNHVQSFYRNFEQIMETTPKSWLSHLD